jgi:hypothetical protein
MMNESKDIDPILVDALTAVANFVGETTGTPATQEELAQALKRYFVLKEIKENIELTRKTS